MAGKAPAIIPRFNHITCEPILEDKIPLEHHEMTVTEFLMNLNKVCMSFAWPPLH
jgi:hypothetical protein